MPCPRRVNVVSMSTYQTPHQARVQVERHSRAVQRLQYHIKPLHKRNPHKGNQTSKKEVGKQDVARNNCSLRTQPASYDGCHSTVILSCPVLFPRPLALSPYSRPLPSLLSFPHFLSSPFLHFSLLHPLTSQPPLYSPRRSGSSCLTRRESSER